MLPGRRRHSIKYFKPYWSHELTTLWKEMNKYEHDFLKYKGTDNNLKKLKHDKFKSSQKQFDKKLRNAARNYQRHVVSEIEELSVGNHKEFWTKLKSLGPRKTTSIPLKVRVGNEIITEEGEVIKKWGNDFSNLFKQENVMGRYDDVFLEEKL